MDSSGVDATTSFECDASQATVAVACAVMPAGLPMLTSMPWGVGGPGTMIDGAEKWGDAAGLIHSAQSTLDGLVSGLSSADWSGDARDAFDQDMQQFGAQLGDSGNLAEAVGACLAGISGPLLGYPFFSAGIAIFMAAEAAFVIAADATILGAAPAEAEGNAAAATCCTVVEAYNWTMAGIMTAAGAGIEIGDAADVRVQEQDGSTTIRDDYKQGQIDGAGEEVLNAFNWSASLAFDKLGDKFGESAVPGASKLATAADKELTETAQKVVGWAFANTSDKAKDWSQIIAKDLADGGDTGDNIASNQPFEPSQPPPFVPPIGQLPPALDPTGPPGRAEGDGGFVPDEDRISGADEINSP